MLGAPLSLGQTPSSACPWSSRLDLDFHAMTQRSESVIQSMSWPLPSVPWGGVAVTTSEHKGVQLRVTAAQ